MSEKPRPPSAMRGNRQTSAPENATINKITRTLSLNPQIYSTDVLEAKRAEYPGIGRLIRGFSTDSKYNIEPGTEGEIYGEDSNISSASSDPENAPSKLSKLANESRQNKGQGDYSLDKRSMIADLANNDDDKTVTIEKIEKLKTDEYKVQMCKAGVCFFVVVSAIVAHQLGYIGGRRTRRNKRKLRKSKRRTSRRSRRRNSSRKNFAR